MSTNSKSDLSSTPRYIRLTPDDNVAIVVNDFGLPAGATFPCGLKLVERVPQGHKVALSNIEAGGAIRRYGHVIGTATRAIAKGAWIEESVVRLPDAPSMSELALATEPCRPAEPLEGFTFEGFR